MLLAVANEAHGSSYTGEEKVVFGSDEHYQQEQKGGVKKRVTDTHLVVYLTGTRKTPKELIVHIALISFNTFLYFGIQKPNNRL